MTSAPSRARSSPRGREEYDPQGMLRDDYDSSPPRVRHDYDHSSKSRVRNDYDQGRNDYGEYERSRAREEYERHSPQTRARDYSPSSRGLKDDYTTREEYGDSQVSRRREEVGENEGDEDEEIDFGPEDTTTTPTAPSSVRVLDDYGDSRLRNDFDYDPEQSILRLDDYPRRDDYPLTTHLHHRSLQHNSEEDDYRCPEEDYEGYGRHYREMMEPLSPSLRNRRHLHPHHHQHQHHHHHHPTDARQVSQQKCV